MKQFDSENLDYQNIKDDVILIQFKLVKKDTCKLLNTLSFVNLPLSKSTDINMSTLIEIINKQNLQSQAKSSR